MTEIIKLSNGDVDIELWSVGARLNRVKAFGQTGLVASAEDDEEAKGAKRNFGAVVGVVANRLARSEASILNETYQLESGPAGIPVCHCGDQGVNVRDWSVTEQSDNHLKFTLSLPHLEDGLPGNRVLSATYRLSEAGFDLDFMATTDAPTIVNLALHPYWTLAGSGRAGQQIKVNATGYLPVDGDKIPLGYVEGVVGIFDLRRLTTPSDQIDHNYDLTARAETGPAATLASERVQLDIETDAPGLQIYTGSEVGIAVEPQHWPDAPHHDNFPSILLRPGETYTQSSSYRFSRL